MGVIEVIYLGVMRAKMSGARAATHATESLSLRLPGPDPHLRLQHQWREIMAQILSGTETSPITNGARYALIALSFLFGIGAVIQIFLAGLSLFESAAYWTDHVDLGRFLGIPALLIPVAAALARGGRQLITMSLAVTLLYILQMVLANVDNGFIGAFHALNAFAVTGAAFQTGGRTLPLVRSDAQAVSGQEVVQRSSD